MYDVCVLVVDAARARFFVDRHEAPPAQFGGKAADAPSWDGRRLSEVADLVQPEARLASGELASESRPGIGRGPSGQAHGYSDHRDAQRDHHDKQFAARVIEQAEACCREADSRRLIVAADPRMLGYLRQNGDRLKRANVAVRDVAKDLTRMRPDEIRQVLVKNELLPWTD
jgi:protein required for attachment to host cells